ncbi:hypothetical protein BKA69DRAFT_650920 [Paraphysoderma sedebokerense]|nr:hypothetical protein BKA69DRAFT_650920 [Paraphysoderma sedebokerense]
MLPSFFTLLDGFLFHPSSQVRFIFISLVNHRTMAGDPDAKPHGARNKNDRRDSGGRRGGRPPAGRHNSSSSIPSTHSHTHSHTHSQKAPSSSQPTNTLSSSSSTNSLSYSSAAASGNQSRSSSSSSLNLNNSLNQSLEKLSSSGAWGIGTGNGVANGIAGGQMASSVSASINGRSVQISLNGFNYVEIKDYMEKNYKDTIHATNDEDRPEYHRNTEKAWSSGGNKPIFTRGVTITSTGADFFSELSKYKSSLGKQ